MGASPAKASQWSGKLHPRRDEVEAAQVLLAGALTAHNFDEAICFAVRLALEEALVNAFRHGNRDDPTKHALVDWSITDDEVTIQVTDQGSGFDPGSVPDPTAEENLEIPSGRGIMLMRAYMTEVEHLAPGNMVRLAYRRKQS